MRTGSLPALILLVAGAGQSAPSSTRDGVYTPAQAERGKSRYQQTCEACHGANLSGGDGAALTGDAFIRNWSGLPLDRLLERVRTMPPDAPAPLSESASADLVAYLLSSNGFQPGARELEAAQAAAIRFDAIGDQDAVPNFSLIQIVGCLTRSAGGTWLLTRAGAPVRTRNPDASQGEDHARAAELPLANATYELRDIYPPPDALQGLKIEAKGFLMRGPVDRVNVTAVAPFDTRCDPRIP